LTGKGDTNFFLVSWRLGGKSLVRSSTSNRESGQKKVVLFLKESQSEIENQ
jgi:hypothetical protein